MDIVKRMFPLEQKVVGLCNLQILRHERSARRFYYFGRDALSKNFQPISYYHATINHCVRNQYHVNGVFRNRNLSLPTHQCIQRHQLSTAAADMAKKTRKAKAKVRSTSKSKSKGFAPKPKPPQPQQVSSRQNPQTRRKVESNEGRSVKRQTNAATREQSNGSAPVLRVASQRKSASLPGRSAPASNIPLEDRTNGMNRAMSNGISKSSIRVTPQHRLRRNASQFIPMWLRREPSWRIAVHEHLNLPLQEQPNQDWSRRINLGASIQGNFYEETIPSFSDVLRSGPPESLNEALDILVNYGLGDTQIAERYRTTSRMRFQNKNWVAACNEKKQQVQYHHQVVQDLVNSIVELQERLVALERPESSLGPFAPDADVSADAPSVSGISSNANLVASEEEAIGEHEAKAVLLNTTTKESHNGTAQEEGPKDSASAERRQQIANLHKIISEKVHSMNQHQRSLDTVLTNLNQLRQEFADAPMDDEEFQAINDASELAKPMVTKVFAEHVRDLHSQMLERYQILDSKTDLTKPQDWYLHARLSRRKVIFHGGPTNSGKTYQALQRLKQAKKGMYVGPLRLLAAEIYERLTAEGIYCNLFTGQEVRDVPFATHKSATVEMTTTSEEYDVVVIDEIQMISDSERGFAWTRALLGVRCSEIHVCGGLEAVDVVKRLVDACGDEFELREYQRFSELQIASHSLARRPDEFGCYKNIQSGDCVVAFSRNDIFAIKREIETSTNHKCCVIYGSLPPSTRSEQARRFNDPDSEYDVLVASDAIGMGLNLNIRRIVFNSVFKNNGSRIVRLDHSSMKQISGRAGRRNSPFPNGSTFNYVLHNELP
jgi:Helicase conserved C-terminal domain